MNADSGITLVGSDTMNAPWSLDSRMALAHAAVQFFSVDDDKDYSRKCSELGIPTPTGRIVPFSIGDFLKFLKRESVFRKQPNVTRVVHLLDALASAGLLLKAGRDERPGSLNPMKDRYILVGGEPEERRNGWLVLASAVGPDLIYRVFQSALVHITGISDTGKAASGTGIVLDSHHIVTCGHVLSDMKVDTRQQFQNRQYEIDEKTFASHPRDDVGVLRLDGPPLTPIPGLAFRPPIVGETVHVLGYPKLPRLRDASVIMQTGTVTSQSVVGMDGRELFLYSAISRPGNSGGPIVSSDGYVVGIVSIDLTGDYEDEAQFAPHFAGVSASVVRTAIQQLCANLFLPFVALE